MLTQNYDGSLITKLRDIKLLALDVDGVLTDGGVYVLDNGQEFRRYCIKDGVGLKAMKSFGIHIAIISSSKCRTVIHRMEKLGIHDVHTGVDNKLAELEIICSGYKIPLESVCYIGDDLPDIRALTAVGLPCAPSDAVPEVKDIVKVITNMPGGYGAVREICDLIAGVL